MRFIKPRRILFARGAYLICIHYLKKEETERNNRTKIHCYISAICIYWNCMIAYLLFLLFHSTDGCGEILIEAFAYVCKFLYGYFIYNKTETNEKSICNVCTRDVICFCLQRPAVQAQCSCNSEIWAKKFYVLALFHLQNSKPKKEYEEGNPTRVPRNNVIIELESFHSIIL